MTQEVAVFLVLAAIVGGFIWAYGHVKAIHDKIDLLLHRNQTVDAQLPPAPAVAPPQAPQPIEVHIHQEPPVVPVVAPSPAPAASPPNPLDSLIRRDPALQAVVDARDAANHAAAAGEDPANRPPYPSWGRVTLTSEKTSGSYLPFTPPAGQFELRVAPILGYEFTLNGVKVNPGRMALEAVPQALSVAGPPGDVDANFVKR